MNSFPATTTSPDVSAASKTSRITQKIELLQQALDICPVGENHVKAHIQGCINELLLERVHELLTKVTRLEEEEKEQGLDTIENETSSSALRPFQSKLMKTMDAIENRMKNEPAHAPYSEPTSHQMTKVSTAEKVKPLITWTVKDTVAFARSLNVSENGVQALKENSIDGVCLKKVVGGPSPESFFSNMSVNDLERIKSGIEGVAYQEVPIAHHRSQNIHRWNTVDVCTWAEQAGVSSQAIAVLREKNADGNMLYYLASEDDQFGLSDKLMWMGVRDSAVCVDLEKKIRALLVDFA